MQRGLKFNLRWFIAVIVFSLGAALQAFEQVLEINPQSVSARLNVQWLRLKLDINGV